MALVRAKDFITSEDYALDNVVIIGGGVIGLALAIALKRKGLDVKLVEFREKYTRLGNLVEVVYSKLTEMLGLEIRPSKSGYIKDLELQLQHYAKSLGIKILKQKFI